MNKKRNKRGTKSGNSGIALKDLDVDILFCVAMGTRTNKQLHAKLRRRKGRQVPKSTISRHTTKLQQLNLLNGRRLFNLKEFYLTDHGNLTISKIMSRGQGLVLGLPVRGHAFGFVCEIVREPKGLHKQLEEGNWVAFYPKNRVAYKRRELGCMVIFNPRSVQFMPPEVYAASEAAAFEEALRLVLQVKELLETDEFPGLVLGDPSQVARVYQQHYARPFDPLANEYYKNSLKTGVQTTYRSERLAVDLSPGLPELETVHRVHAKDDLRKITEFYEQMVRGALSWNDLEALRLQLPEWMGDVMQRLDVLAKGELGRDEVLSHLTGAVVNLTGNLDRILNQKPAPRRRPKRRRPVPAPKTQRQADERIDEIRKRVEETLAKLRKYEG